jgi:hypothetical protein
MKMTRQTIRVKVKIELEEEMEINAWHLRDMSIEEYIHENFQYEIGDIVDYIEHEVV